MNNGSAKLSRRQMIWIVGALVAILVIGGVWWWIRSGQIVSTDDARIKGTIVAISSKGSGRVEKVLVAEGERVEKGQILLIMEKEETEALVDQARANLAAAQAKLQMLQSGNRNQEIAQTDAVVLQKEANLENAQQEYERNQRLFAGGAASARDVDNSRTTYQVAQAQLKSAQEQRSLMVEGFRPEDIAMAQAQVKQMEAALKNLEIQLADRVVKAPVNGIIALKSVEPGVIVVPGQPLFSVSDLDDVWVAANIEETYVGRIQKDAEVKFTVDAYPGQTFTGVVQHVGPTANSQLSLLPSENSSGNFTKVTQRLPVRIKADPSEFVLKPGMSAIVEVYTK